MSRERRVAVLIVAVLLLSGFLAGVMVGRASAPAPPAIVVPEPEPSPPPSAETGMVDWPAFFDALEAEESTPNNPLGITVAYWTDACKLMGVDWPLEFRRRRTESRIAARAYLEHHAPALDVRTLARVHNGGPGGHREKATWAFGERVAARYQWELRR